MVAEALPAIETAAQSLEFRSKPLDAKAERVVLQKAKEEMRKELSSCGAADINAALVLGTCLAAAMFRRCNPSTFVSVDIIIIPNLKQFCSSLITTPKNCVAAVLDALATTTPSSPALEEAIAALKVRHHLSSPMITATFPTSQ